MTTEREALARAMAALVDDRAMAVPFVRAYGHRLAYVVRKCLRRRGRGDLARDRDEVQGLVWDVALLLHEQGAGWDPNGALPWSWAWRPIEALVAAAAGHPVAELDVDVLDERVESGDHRWSVGTAVDFEVLADANALLGLYRDALAEVQVSDRNRLVHREYRIQKGLGDPSPSHTVAAELGLGEANVRQIDRRVRCKLATLVAAEPRYRALRAIPWLDLPTDPDPSPAPDGGGAGRAERAACR